MISYGIRVRPLSVESFLRELGNLIFIHSTQGLVSNNEKSANKLFLKVYIFTKNHPPFVNRHFPHIALQTFSRRQANVEHKSRIIFARLNVSLEVCFGGAPSF